MPLPAFHEILADPEFSQASVERQKDINKQYWDLYEKENPGDEWAKAQRTDADAALTAKEKLATAPSIIKRGLELQKEAANFRLGVRNADRVGDWESKEARDAFVTTRQTELETKRAQLDKTASLFNEETDAKMQPTWQALQKHALEGGMFGEAPASSLMNPWKRNEDFGKARNSYKKLRDSVATDFNLAPEELDDLVKHRMDLQEAPISRDALGVVHVKRDLLAKGNDDFQQAIARSNLPDSVKSDVSIEAPLRLAKFRADFIEQVKQGHPELAADIKWTGDTEKDFAAISDTLNATKTSQLSGGAEAAVIKRTKFAELVPGSTAGFGLRGAGVPLNEQNIERFRAADNYQKKLDSVNQLSDVINQEKVRIFGVNAATIGGGMVSGGESLLIGAFTGGAGNLAITADRIAKAGKAGKVILGATQRGLNTAPIASLYGGEQAFETYERTGDLGLAAAAFAAEAGFTLAFGALKMGGVEDVGQKLANATLRRELGKSIGKAWAQFAVSAGGTVLSEIPEEMLISLTTDLWVESKINPSMTVSDVKKHLYDTMVSTVFASGPIGAVGAGAEQGSNLFKSTYEQTDSELHDTADALSKTAAKENLLAPENEGGAVKASSDAGVAPSRKMTREELVEAIEQERAVLEGASAGNAEITLPDGTVIPAVEARGRTLEEQRSLEALQGTPEEVAARWDIELIESKESPPASEPGGEVAVEETPAKAEAETITTPTDEKEKQGQGLQEVSETDTASAEVTTKQGNPNFYEISDASGNKVGQAILSEHRKGEFLLDAIDIDEDQQKKGYGTKLVREVATGLVGKGATILRSSNEGQGTVQILDRVFGRDNVKHFIGQEEITYDEAVKYNKEYVTTRSEVDVTNFAKQQATSVSTEGTTAQIAAAKKLVGKEELTRRAQLWEEANSSASPQMEVGLEWAAHHTAKGTWDALEPTLQKRVGNNLPAKSSKPTPDLLNAPIEDIARAALENPTAENAALLVFAAAGTRPASLPSQPATETTEEPVSEESPTGPIIDKNGQLQLFQTPEPAKDSDPAVTNYLRNNPKPEEAMPLDEIGEWLFEEVRDANLSPSEKRILDLINRTFEGAMKVVGKGAKLKTVVKLGSVKMNELLGKIWKIKNRRAPGWQNYQSTDNVRSRARIIAHEIVASLARTGSGVDWYRGKIAEMYDKLSSVFPELREPGQPRFIFSTVLAITSNGENVFNNMDHAVKLYEKIRGEGRMPASKDAYGMAAREKAMFKAFVRIQEQIDKHGWEQVDKDLRTEMPYKAMRKKYGITGTNEEKPNQTVLGSYMLGSKIGSFWGNLNGIFNHPAMDLWFTRTMSRLSGDFQTLSADSLKKPLKILFEQEEGAIPEEVLDEIQIYLNDVPTEPGDSNWTSIPAEIREKIPTAYAWLKKTTNKYANRKDAVTGKTYADGTYVERQVKSAFELIDKGNRAPEGADHRVWMRRVLSAAKKHLKEQGVDLSLAEMQAILWFHEKDLYTKFGATSKMGERADFAQAAENTLSKRRMRPAGDAGPRQEAEQMQLFQDSEGPKGTYTPKAVAKAAGVSKAVLELLEGKSDTSTGIHEAGHAVEDFLEEIGEGDKAEALRTWAKENGKTEWREQREFIARGFERFVVNGVKTGVEAVDKAFARIAEIMLNIYRGIKGSSIDIDIPPHIEKIFNDLLSRGAQLESEGKKPDALPVEIVETSPDAPKKPAAKPAEKPAAKPAPAKPKAKRLGPLPRQTQEVDDFGIRKVVTDAIRREHGMSDSDLKVSVTDQEAWDEALLRVARATAYANADPEAQAKMPRPPLTGNALVENLIDNPRNTDKYDKALLAHEGLIRERAVEKARVSAKQLPDTATAAERANAQAKLNNAIQDLQLLLDVIRLQGSKAGLALQAMKLVVSRQFELSKMLADARSSKNANSRMKKDLTEEEVDKITKLSESLKKMTEERDKVGTVLDDTQRELDRAKYELETLKMIKKADRVPRVTPERRSMSERGAELKQSARDALAALGFGRRTLEQRKEGTLRQSPELPAEALKAFADLVTALRIEGKTNSAIEAELVESYGDVVLDHADKIFAAADETIKKVAAGSRTKTPQELASLLDPEKELSNRMVFNMVVGFLRQGLRGDAVLTAVTDLLNKSGMEVTRTQVSDAYTSYGKAKFPSKDELLTKARELRRVELIKRQLDVVRSGALPEKTGLQRDEASPEVRALQEQLNEAKRAGGLKHSYRREQQKGYLDSLKTRLRNDIVDIDAAIDKNERINKTRRTPEYDAELLALKAQKAARQKAYDEHFGVDRKEMTDKQRIAATERLLDKAIAEEERMEREGILVREKPVSKTPQTAGILARKARLAELRKLRREAQEIANPKKTAAERANERLKLSAKKSIERFQEILRTGVFPKKPDGTAFTPDEDLQELQELRDTLADAVAELREDQKPRTSPQERARRQAVAQLTKTINELTRRIDSRDFSKKTKGQGLAAGDPQVRAMKETVKNLRDTLKAMENEGLVVVTAEEKREASLLKAKDKRLKAILERIRTKDYSKPEKKAPLITRRLAELDMKISKAKNEWEDMRRKWVLSNKNFGGKAWYYAKGLLQLRKILVLGLELGVVGRQGNIFTVTGLVFHPARVARVIAKSIRAFSKTSEVEMYNAMMEDPLAIWFPILEKTAGWRLHNPHDEGYGNMEDLPDPELLNKLAKLRGIGIPAEVILGVERFTRVFLNAARIEMLRSFAKTSRNEEPTLEEMKVYSNAVMNATGRGSFKDQRLDTGVALGNVLTISTRWLVSRAKMTTLEPVWTTRADIGTTKRARVKVLWELYGKTLIARTLLTNAMVLAAGFGRGDDDDDEDEIILDPRSTKFGAVRYKGATIDISGGLRQHVNLIARLATGEKVTAKGELIKIRGEGSSRYTGTTDDEVWNFVRSRTNVNLGLALDLIRGKFYGDQPVTVATASTKLMSPIIVGDTIALFKNYSPTEAVILWNAMFLGATVSVPFSTGTDKAPKSLNAPVKNTPVKR